MCSSRNLRISSLVSSPPSSPEIAPKRSSALPPFASMQTRSFAATSILSASYSAKACCQAHRCTPAAVSCALTRRRFCMSALLLSDVSSCRIASTSSGISETVLVTVWMRSWTAFSRAFTTSRDAPTRPLLSLSSSSLSFLDSADKDSASASALWTFGSKSPNSASTSELVFAISAFFSSTRPRRFSAWILSTSSCSRRFARRDCPRSSSRAMPTADFSSWKSANARPLRPCRKSCLQILSKFARGRSKPNTSLAHTTTSSRFRRPSPSLSNFLNKAAFFSALFDEATFLAMRSLCSLALERASVACRVACWMRGWSAVIAAVLSALMFSASSITGRFCTRKSAQAEHADIAAFPACSTARLTRTTSMLSMLPASPDSGAAPWCAFSAACSALVTRPPSSSMRARAFFSWSCTFCCCCARSSSHFRCWSRICSTYCFAYWSTRSASALRISCCAPVSGSSVSSTWSSSLWRASKLSGLALESFWSTRSTARVACCCRRTLASSSRRFASSSWRFSSSSALSFTSSSCRRHSSRRFFSSSSLRSSSSCRRRSSSCRRRRSRSASSTRRRSMSSAARLRRSASARRSRRALSAPRRSSSRCWCSSCCSSHSSFASLLCQEPFPPCSVTQSR
mmetsp:Transcript_57006/g.152598  ORF Transcript_57006/g.152598 Transcript_57006/m.152598 type:complete len:629 (+) Transcript_57006:961-2847(+)